MKGVGSGTMRVGWLIGRLGVISVPAVAIGLGLEERVVRRHVARLQEAGWLSRTAGIRGQGSLVWLTSAGLKGVGLGGLRAVPASPAPSATLSTQSLLVAWSPGQRSARSAAAGGGPPDASWPSTLTAGRWRCQSPSAGWCAGSWTWWCGCRPTRSRSRSSANRANAVLIANTRSLRAGAHKRQRRAPKKTGSERGRSFAGRSTTRSTAVGLSEPTSSGRRSALASTTHCAAAHLAAECAVVAVAVDRGVDGRDPRPVHGRRGRVSAGVLVRAGRASPAAVRSGAGAL